MEAAGLIGVTPHALRATCASWVAEQHGVLEAARRLGHSSASVTTRHYARALHGGDEGVAVALDVRRLGVVRTHEHLNVSVDVQVLAGIPEAGRADAANLASYA